MKWQSLANISSIFLAIAPIIGDAQESVNDDTNYLGDRLSFPVDIKAEYTKFDETDVNNICIPAGTTLRGLGGEFKDDDDVKKLKVRLGTFTSTVDDCDTENDNAIKLPNVALTIEINEEEGIIPNRYGLTYGGLVVPYKYHFSGSKNFNGNSTVGPYLGYRFDQNATIGVGVKLVGFLGGSVIEVSQTDGDTESLAGFSYGLGLLGTIKNEFEFGLVFGQDKVSEDSDYEDDGKWWGAIALGYSFAN